MEITLRYRTTRREIWRSYWNLWRQHLWKYQALVCLAILVSVAAVSRGNLVTIVTEASVLSAIVIAFFVIYPLVMRKADLRTLIVSERGIETTIGKQSKEIEWGAIASIEEMPDFIRIRNRNFNSFLVPNRAFASEADRAHFLGEVMRWHGEAARPG